MPDDLGSAHGGVFRHILVGFDGSSEAQRALHVATALAADLGGEAHVLLVVRPGAHAETQEERDRAIAAERENLSRGLRGIENQTQGRFEISAEVIYSDDPAVALGHYAEEHGFDIMVVGGHGREQATHRGIGKSLEVLLRHHSCPVLVV